MNFYIDIVSGNIPTFGICMLLLEQNYFVTVIYTMKGQVQCLLQIDEIIITSIMATRWVYLLLRIVPEARVQTPFSKKSSLKLENRYGSERGTISDEMN